MKSFDEFYRYSYLAFYALKIVAKTFKLFGFRKWTLFWFKSGSAATIKINDLSFRVRTSTFKLRVSDVLAIIECLIQSDYEPIGFEISETDTILDVGSHIGCFSICAAKKATKGLVYSFEPSPENFKLLSRNIKENSVKNIKPLKLGIANNTGYRKFYFSEFSPLSNNLYMSSGDSLLTKVISLNDFFLEKRIKKCNFLKIDCEGAEYEIILGLTPETINKIEKIACEFHTPKYFGITNKKSTLLNLISFLHNNSFEVNIKNTTPFTGLLYAQKKSSARSS
jgi:FkbM family methyltransferase